MSKLSIYCFVVLFFFTSFSYAANTGKIAGRVVDAKSGEALPGVNVVIDGTTVGAATDANGYYVILKVPPSTYTLAASMIGYQIVKVTQVQVNVARTSQINFKLEPTVIEVSEAITVVAERPPVPPDRTTSEVFVDAKAIQALPTNTVEEVIQLQPGIFGQHVRGGEIEETAFYLDGVKTKDGLNNANYSKVNVYAIQEMQLLTGGFNAEYGNVQSGVINITLKEGSPHKYSGMAGFRWKPAGIYHWESHMFAKDNFEWRYADINHPIWTENYPANPDTPENETQIYFDEYMRMIQPPSLFMDYDKYHSSRYDLTFGGPIPLLRGSSFFFAGRVDRPAPIFPDGRKQNIDDNYNLILTYPLTKNLKFTLNGMYGVDELNSFSKGGKPEAKFFFIGGQSANRYDAQSLKLTHVLGSRTYYDLLFSRYSRKRDGHTLYYPEWTWDVHDILGYRLVWPTDGSVKSCMKK